MPWLILVSLLWAFSFGLIKTHLSGLDATVVATLRLALALLVFLPFLRPRKIAFRPALLLALIGAVQFGLMYALYMSAFQFLQAHEVALFTIFTPLYITLFSALRERRLSARRAFATLLAIVGAGVILWHGTSSPQLLQGFFLVQLSNLCFALGQLAYKRIRPSITNPHDAQIFGWLLLGGFLATGAYSLLASNWADFSASGTQWLVLAYLGTIASGLGFFGWNRGVLQVNPGTLAVFNNLKIPLAVICSLLFFSAQVDAPERLLASFLLLVGAIWLAESDGEKVGKK